MADAAKNTQYWSDQVADAKDSNDEEAAQRLRDAQQRLRDAQLAEAQPSHLGLGHPERARYETAESLLARRAEEAAGH